MNINRIKRFYGNVDEFFSTNRREFTGANGKTYVFLREPTPEVLLPVIDTAIQERDEAREWARRMKAERDEEQKWHAHYSMRLAEEEKSNAELIEALDEAEAALAVLDKRCAELERDNTRLVTAYDILKSWCGR